MNDTIEFQSLQIKALQKENERLNNEIRKFKKLALKVTLSDHAFDKPIADIETNYEVQM